ncbi:MAG: glycerophosphodiester phosphodiesterase [Acidobacteria bacterium]|nr:glycerophosphodiester phosphodiesterase [Acidobacteriota bacterium]MCA1609487.1 glycerophosphodiester phosphodiesterase [Acidobacteriota bacterium]
MTMLGRANPLERIFRGVRGKLWPGRGVSAAAPRTVRVIAHRGAARVRAENTIEAYAAAVDLGADGVEADVCVTRDGRFVIWHDADPGEKIALARQSGREGLLCTPDVPTLVSKWRRRVKDLDYEDFRTHYGYRLREGGIADLIGNDDPPKIPAATFDDLIAWADREPRLATICLDIKLAPDQTDSAARLFDLLRDLFAERRDAAFPAVALLTPQREIFEAFQRESARHPHDDRLTVHADFELPGVLAAARRLRFRRVSMGVGQRFWPGFRDEVADVVRARERGELDAVIVWTLNEPDRLARLVAFGVDGILTDEPAALRKMISEGRSESLRSRHSEARARS